MAYYWHISMEMNLSWTQEGVLMMMGRKLVAPKMLFFYEAQFELWSYTNCCWVGVQKYYFFRALVKTMKYLYPAVT